MNPRGQDPLLLSGKDVTIILQAIVGIGAAALAIALPFVTVFEGDIAKGFADGSEIPIQDLPFAPTAALLVVCRSCLLLYSCSSASCVRSSTPWARVIPLRRPMPGGSAAWPG